MVVEKLEGSSLALTSVGCVSKTISSSMTRMEHPLKFISTSSLPSNFLLSAFTPGKTYCSSLYVGGWHYPSSWRQKWSWALCLGREKLTGESTDPCPRACFEWWHQCRFCSTSSSRPTAEPGEAGCWGKPWSTKDRQQLLEPRVHSTLKIRHGASPH